MKNVEITAQPIPPRLWRLGAWATGIALLIALGIFLVQSGLLSNIGSSADTPSSAAASTTASSGGSQTVALRPSTAGVGLVSAAGNLTVANEQQVVVATGGAVKSIAVNVGDQVVAGQVLAVLDSSAAELAVKQALLSMASSQAALNNLLTPASADQIAAAQATLKASQANLTDVMNGAGAQEVAAAQSSLAAAQANYNDLLAPPSDDAILQLKATMSKAQVAVAAAQTAYDKIAWQNNAGMTSQAADLQSATIDYESAEAAYNEATAPAADGDVQSAVSAIQNARQTLDNLLAEPSAADVATAQASVASAQQSLQDLLDGQDSASVAAARATLAQSQLDLQSASTDLATTEVRAPISGAVLSLDLAIGQQANAGVTAFTLADTSKLLLTVNVAETDIAQVSAGMPATITLDALPDKSFAGEVLRIAPSSDASSTVVNYPVTIQLTADDLTGVRAGMTAVAEMQSAGLSGAWLAPRSAVQVVNGQSQLTILRNDTQITLPVTTGQIQGEWVIVQSPQLQAGDKVAAVLTTTVNEQQKTRVTGAWAADCPLAD